MTSFSRKGTYLSAEERARAGGVGLWICAQGTASGDATPTATAGSATTTATATSAGDGVVVAEIHEIAEGPDGEDLNDEYVVLTNRGDHTRDVSGWTVADETGHKYTFPDGITIEPGATVTVHTSSGTDSR